jgi:hypothetical protein
MAFGLPSQRLCDPTHLSRFKNRINHDAARTVEPAHLSKVGVFAAGGGAIFVAGQHRARARVEPVADHQGFFGGGSVQPDGATQQFFANLGGAFGSGNFSSIFVVKLSVSLEES